MTKSNEIPEINIGVVGHIDHGKTTLLHRLTGKFADTHSEELKRGITIKLGYADMIIYRKESPEENGEDFSAEKKPGFSPFRYISFIDVPGHEMLMATMLSGASIIDAAILVIAANEGIKPQTKEHLIALQTKKISSIIIVQNKIDLVTKEQAKKSHNEIKQFLKGTMAENAPIVPISAQKGINIGFLLEEICKLKIPERDEKANPLFLIARSFDINRPGTKVINLKGGILGGILKKGILREGDEIEIKPGLNIKKSNQTTYKTLTTKILALYKGSEKVSEVKPGASIAIETGLDPNLAKADSLNGCIVSKVGMLPEISHRIKVRYELFHEAFGTENHEKVTPLKSKEMLMLNINTTTTVGVVEDIKGNIFGLSLNIPALPIEKSNVGIARNINGHWRLIGWGEIVP